MGNLIIPSKSDFDYNEEYQKLYTLTGHWQSDLEFYKIALLFLYYLIDKYFVWFAHKDHHDEMTNLASRLYEVVTVCDTLLEKTSKTLSHLAELIDEPFKYDFHKCRTEHKELENEIVSFIKKFRDIKTETFVVAEQVIQQEIKRLSY